MKAMTKTISWQQIKNYYTAAARRGQLVTVILAQARRKYGTDANLRRVGIVHRAGDYLEINLSSDDGNYDVSLFIHRTQAKLNYCLLFNRQKQLVYRLPADDQHTQS